MGLLVDIKRVQLLDDDPDVRQAYADQVSDANLVPIIEDGTWLGSLQEYVQQDRKADAGLSDFNLESGGYAAFNGAELVEAWYDLSFPAILCTRFEKTHIEQIRPHRRKIPVLLTPDELNQDSILVGLEECVRELQGAFRAFRRPWRTQVHFLAEQDEQNEDSLLVELPAWTSTEIVRVRRKDLPGWRTNVVPDFRCYADVNLGAESAEELYICDWRLE